MIMIIITLPIPITAVTFNIHRNPRSDQHLLSRITTRIIRVIWIIRIIRIIIRIVIRIILVIVGIIVHNCSDHNVILVILVIIASAGDEIAAHRHGDEQQGKKFQCFHKYKIKG